MRRRKCVHAWAIQGQDGNLGKRTKQHSKGRARTPGCREAQEEAQGGRGVGPPLIRQLSCPVGGRSNCQPCFRDVPRQLPNRPVHARCCCTNCHTTGANPPLHSPPGRHPSPHPAAPSPRRSCKLQHRTASRRGSTKRGRQQLTAAVSGARQGAVLLLLPLSRGCCARNRPRTSPVWMWALT